MIPPLDLADLNRKLDEWCAHLAEVEPTVADPERRMQLRQALEQIRQGQATVNAEYQKEIDSLAARTAAVQKQNAETLAQLEALQREAAAAPEAPAPSVAIDPGRGMARRDELLQRYAKRRPGAPAAPASEGFSGDYSAGDPYQHAREAEQSQSDQSWDDPDSQPMPEPVLEAPNPRNFGIADPTGTYPHGGSDRLRGVDRDVQLPPIVLWPRGIKLVALSPAVMLPAPAAENFHYARVWKPRSALLRTARRSHAKKDATTASSVSSTGAPTSAVRARPARDPNQPPRPQRPVGHQFQTSNPAAVAPQQIGMR